jgi:putative transcriptional regulator
VRYRLYIERTKRELTQEQVAIIAKVTRAGYSHIESGHRNPSWSVVQRLENFFGIPASELLAESEELATGTEGR